MILSLNMMSKLGKFFYFSANENSYNVKKVYNWKQIGKFLKNIKKIEEVR